MRLSQTGVRMARLLEPLLVAFVAFVALVASLAKANSTLKAMDASR